MIKTKYSTRTCQHIYCAGYT